MLFLHANIQWRIQDGAFGANALPQPAHLVEEPAIVLIKILNLCQAKISLFIYLLILYRSINKIKQYLRA